MLALLRDKLPETLRAIAPLVGVVMALQLAALGPSTATTLQFLLGAGLVTLGMLLLLAGVDFGLLPMGRFIGAALPRRRSLSLLFAVAFGLGFATTAAEPDVLVLATQVARTTDGALSRIRLVSAMSTGVGLFTAVALVRVVWGLPLAGLMTAIYALMIGLSLYAPDALLPVAYDAGSVTTGVLTTPVVLALAIGVSSVLAGRSAVDGFGLLGMASSGPILIILLQGLR